MMVPLAVGDFVCVALPDDDRVIRRRVREIVFHEIDMQRAGGLKDVPCPRFVLRFSGTMDSVPVTAVVQLDAC